MKKILSPLLVLALIISAAALSGCASSSSKYAQEEVNLLGIVKYTPESYERVPATTLGVHTDELVARRNVSGDNLQLFWGLFTFADY